MAEIMVVASGKGGVGKTFFTANFGARLAMDGASVLLIDMNIGTRSLDISLGLENKIIYDLSDAIRGTCRLKQALVRDRRFRDLYLLSAPQNRSKADFTTEDMRQLCRELEDRFSYILLDAPAGINEDLRRAAAPAGRGVIVTAPEHTAIRDAELMDTVLLSLGIEKRSVVINRILPELLRRGIVPDPAEIAEHLRPPVVGLIPYDINVHISANIGVPVVLSEDSYISRNMAGIAERILGPGAWIRNGTDQSNGDGHI